MRFTRIMVVDIEATCWSSRAPKGQRSEIIEIGICPVDTKSGKLLEPRSIIVRPEHSSISEYCTNLTTLTQEQVDSGVTFREACSILITEYETREYMWASFGNYDKGQFELQCGMERIRYPFSNNHINVKSLFALMYSLPKQVNMPEALEILKMPLEGKLHRGVDDAQNISKILVDLLFKNRKKVDNDSTASG